MDSLLGDAKGFGSLVASTAHPPDPAFSNKSCDGSAERRPVLAEKIRQPGNIEIRALSDRDHSAILQWRYAFLADLLNKNRDSNLLKPANEMAWIGVKCQKRHFFSCLYGDLYSQFIAAF